MVTYRESRVLFLRTSKSEGLQAVERGLIAVLFPEENQVTYLNDIFSQLNQELFAAMLTQLYLEEYSALKQSHFLQEGVQRASGLRGWFFKNWKTSPLQLSVVGSEHLTEIEKFIAYLNSSEPFINQDGGQLFYTYLPYAIVSDSELNWWRRFSTANWAFPNWYADQALELTPQLLLGGIQAAADDLFRVINSVEVPKLL